MGDRLAEAVTGPAAETDDASPDLKRGNDEVGERPGVPGVAGRDTVPTHVGIIPDGNRRWAKRAGKALTETYSLAARRLDDILVHLAGRGVRYITVWPFSPRNWQRGRAEVSDILSAVQEYLIFAALAYPSRGFRYRTIGSIERLTRLAPDLGHALTDLEATTADCAGATVVMAFDYGGRDEIVRAVARLLSAGVRPDELSTDLLARHLDTDFLPDPDLVIRPGGDRRHSGFLLYQAEYAEYHFTETLMPDLVTAEIDAILDRYASRRYSQ